MQRVFVGMSGGVDSSVAAKRLIERGYEVVGVFIKVWQPDFIRCDWEKERLDAMRVAAHLGIPFLTMSAEEEYKRDVAEYMVQAYKKGLTPNPDVMCNEHVKFGAFYSWARAHGADFIATGHYAQLQTVNGITSLHRAVDHGKDQSYFLSRIKREVLPHVLFPIGDTLKEDVRREAELARIPTAAKADSQGICFLGQVDMRSFLSHYITLETGLVCDTAANVIGEHHGAILYTLGQRHGFEITTKGENAHPHYVVARDLETNTITVNETPPMQKAGDTIALHDMNVLGTGLKETMQAVFRYRGAEAQVRVENRGDEGVILQTTSATVQTPAAGQMCVLYAGDECCGGGIIS